MKEIYSDEELLDITKQVLSDYDNTMEGLHQRYHEENTPFTYEQQIPKLIDSLLSKEGISPDIQEFLAQLQNS